MAEQKLLGELSDSEHTGDASGSEPSGEVVDSSLRAGHGAFRSPRNLPGGPGATHRLLAELIDWVVGFI